MGASEPSDAVSDDALLGGRLRYRQPSEGYRVGLEAPLLAAFALPEGRRAPRRAADLGAGPGAVGLCVALKAPAARVTLVEPDALHASLARHNVEQNGLSGRVSVLEHEASGVDQALGRGGFDLVVTNPPWFFEGAGASAAGERRAGSRELGRGELDAIVAAARQLLGRGGRVCVCFPTATLPSLLSTLALSGLHAKRLRMLHPRPTKPANAVFVEALAGKPGGLSVEPPWVVRGEGEAYSPEIRGLLWGLV